MARDELGIGINADEIEIAHRIAQLRNKFLQDSKVTR